MSEYLWLAIGGSVAIVFAGALWWAYWSGHDASDLKWVTRRSREVDAANEAQRLADEQMDQEIDAANQVAADRAKRLNDAAEIRRTIERLDGIDPS